MLQERPLLVDHVLGDLEGLAAVVVGLVGLGVGVLLGSVAGEVELEVVVLVVLDEEEVDLVGETLDEGNQLGDATAVAELSVGGREKRDKLRGLR